MYNELTRQTIEFYRSGKWSLEDMLNHLCKCNYTPFLNKDGDQGWALSFACHKRQYGAANTLTITHNHKRWRKSIKSAVLCALEYKLEDQNE